MKAGDKVIFTGHEYQRAKDYHYDVLFGSKPHTVKRVVTSCCNSFLVFEDIDGMYNQIFFKKVA